MTVYLVRQLTFSAAHRLHSSHLSEDDNRKVFGKCNNFYGHGHDYVVQVTVSGKPDPRTGMVMNLFDLDSIVNEEIIKPLDHKHLNHDITWLHNVNPTMENLVVIFWQRLKPRLTHYLYEIKLFENPIDFAVYRGE